MTPPARPGSGATILLVEDDDETRFAVVRILTAHGYRVIEAATGRDALRHWDARRPDVVLLDLGPPDMDGLEVVRRFGRRGARRS